MSLDEVEDDAEEWKDQWSKDHDESLEFESALATRAYPVARGPRASEQTQSQRGSPRMRTTIISVGTRSTDKARYAKDPINLE